MNDEERRIITQYVERVAGAAPAQSSPWGGSVPSTQARPNLPPVDRDADALIGELFARYPEARYRITQTAFVQEAALVEAQNRIRQLEWELENVKRQAQSAQQSRGGLFGGMFGGGQQRPAAPMPPPPQPVYPPGYNPGMLAPQRGGSGFLGTALTTAAGVAGGMVLGNMLMNAFSGHAGAAQAAAFEGGGTGGFGEEAVPAASPWTDPGSAGGGWGTPDDAAPAGYDAGNAGYDNQTGFDSGNAGYDNNNAGYDTGDAGYDDAGGGGYDDEEI